MQNKEDSPFITKKLPLDHEGYTKSFSIHNFNQVQVKQFYEDFGFVIFDNILTEDEIDLSIDAIWEQIKAYNQEADKNDPKTWQFYGGLGRYGFVNERPSQQLQFWKNRTNPLIYKAFKRLYEITSEQTITQPMLCLFDRASMLRPTNLNPEWKSSSIYHFDIHPWWWTNVVKDPQSRWRLQSMYNAYFSKCLGEGNYVPKVGNFTKLQGVLALSNTNPSSGGFQCVPGFQNYIQEWCQKTPEGMRITKCPELLNNMQRCYQRAGSILVFSRELPHNIFPNQSDKFRYAQYVRMAPESSLMLTEQQKQIRIKEVRKMIHPKLDLNNPLCKEIFMLQ